MSITSLEVKKVVFPQPFEIGLETHTIDTKPGENEILVKSLYSLISPGTELSFYTGTHIGLPDPANTWAKYPFYPGYTTVGEVIAAGKQVGDVAVGDKVLIDETHASYNLMPYSRNSVVKLPETIPLKRALFAYLAGISINSIIQTKVQIGDIAVVLGMGLIGNLACQLYALQGAIPIGVDQVERRLALARETKIAHTVLSGPGTDLGGMVREAAGGANPDIVVEATGVPALTNIALELVRDRGQVTLLGSPTGKLEIDIYHHIHRKGIFVIGANGRIGGIDGLPDAGTTLRYVTDMIDRGALSVDPLLTHIVPPSGAKDAYEMLHTDKANALGIVIDWS